jgi:hypothetical protein
VPAEHRERTVSRTRKRLILAVGVVLMVAITVFGVLQLRPGDTVDPVAEDDEPSPLPTANDVTNQFLAAFSAGQAQEAGRLTDNEAAATAQLTEIWRTLTPSSVRTERTEITEPAADATTADHKFTLTWSFTEQRSWSYPSSLHLVKNGAGWRVQWLPTLVHPNLAAGQSLALREGTGQPAVVDRDGAPLVTWTDDGTTAADPAVAPQLVGALGRFAGEQGPVAGWYVALVDAAGAELGILHGTGPTPIPSTLSVSVQKAAQAAVDSQALPTMLVAIQPSTGDLLAVAQNATASHDAFALHGLYPAGSTFKIATATALIEHGIADVDTTVPCPASTTVGQRTISNAGDFALGDVSLKEAFAESCNTTFAAKAADLPAGALTEAADQFGLGADFEIPGVTTEVGKVSNPLSTAELAESSIGQGTVQVSCFGVALMSATVAAGRAITPRLWRDVPTVVATPYEAPPSSVLTSVRAMMRAVVTSGRGEALAKYGNVYGKTGTAEIGGGNAHGWFTGYRGDVAFATLVLDGQSSSVAVAVTGEFLGGLG